MSASSDSLSDKAYIEHKEDVAADVKPQQEEEAQAVDPKFAIRVRRKIDMRLIPILAALYCISLIDRYFVLSTRNSNAEADASVHNRTNISVARVAGMAKDLKLTVGERYSIVTCVFFVPYSEAQYLPCASWRMHADLSARQSSSSCLRT